MKKNWVVYVLRSKPDRNLFYCGMTGNIEKRIRQHNGEITGGGKYTSSHRPWEIAAIIPVSDKSSALKVEYWLKAKNYPTAGFTGIDYTRPRASDIPRDCPVKRRAFLINETMKKHGLVEILFFDKDLRLQFNAASNAKKDV